MRNGGGGASMFRAPRVYVGIYDITIYAALKNGAKGGGLAPLRWPDRVVGTSHQGHKVV